MLSILPTQQLHPPGSAAAPAARIGTAVVTECTGERATVAFEGGLVASRLALAYAYQPVPGDVVLIIIQAEAAFVIGVLSGRGATALQAPGDLTITAPHGRITLSAGAGIELEAPQVALRAQSLEMLATTLVQSVQSAFKTFSDLLHIRAGRRQTEIDGISMESTERTYHRSKKETVINGESINIA
jgi:hypothetical protein